MIEILDIIAYVIIASAVVFAVYKFVRFFTASSCSCSCGNCPYSKR